MKIIFVPSPQVEWRNIEIVPIPQEEKEIPIKTLT